MYVQSIDTEPNLKTMSMMFRFKSYKMPQIFAAFAGNYNVKIKCIFLDSSNIQKLFTKIWFKIMFI